MADFVDFNYANFIFQAAPGDEGTVRDMPCFRGAGVTIAAVKLSEAELEEVAKTGVVWLSVIGDGWYPTAVTTTPPFTRPNGVVVEPVIPRKKRSKDV